MDLRRGIRSTGLLTLLALALLAGGCAKKAPLPPPPTPPPPPAPAAPTATLRAMPSVIEKGQSTNLSWNSTNATELRLEPGLGSVGPQGSSSVSPDRSTTYTLVATGPGGRAEATARVTVNIPPPPPPPTPTCIAMYTVVSGDTLWGIAERFYGSGAAWPKIFDANRAVIGGDPNLIRVGQVLCIPP